GVRGEQRPQLSLDDRALPMNAAADALEPVLAGRPSAFSWHVLVNGAPAKPEDLRQFVSVWPVLDYERLEPGRAAIHAIRAAVNDAKLDSTFFPNMPLT